MLLTCAVEVEPPSVGYPERACGDAVQIRKEKRGPCGPRPVLEVLGCACRMHGVPYCGPRAGWGLPRVRSVGVRTRSSVPGKLVPPRTPPREMAPLESSRGRV